MDGLAEYGIDLDHPYRYAISTITVLTLWSTDVQHRKLDISLSLSTSSYQEEYDSPLLSSSISKPTS
jgi:hypothetical protein